MTGRPSPIASQHAAVEHSLTNQPPAGDDIVEAFEELRDYFKNAGHAIVSFCPNGREKALALTHIEEATMWAIKAIALNQESARAHWRHELTGNVAAGGVEPSLSASDARFDRVWEAIKGWDLSRALPDDGKRMYSGATGDDVRAILAALDGA
jgi:hypothetical protein